MPTPLDKLFESSSDPGTPKWNVEVFKRAYVYPGSDFQRGMQRIRSGFSVLVYLPGNCMRAAADILMGGPIVRGKRVKTASCLGPLV